MKKIVFALVTIITVLFVSELLLHVITGIVPAAHTMLSSKPIVVPPLEDKRLGVRPNPAHPDHDAKGFRNAAVPQTAAIVALGDSQTYGNAVARYQAWPQQLQKISGLATYNMAYCGYGVAHYLLLFDEARSIHPERIIQTVYAGNDLYDIFTVVYTKHQFPDLVTNDENLYREIQALESHQSLEAKQRFYFKIPTDLPTPAQALRGTEHTKKNVRHSISQHCRLYGLMKACERVLRYHFDLSYVVWGAIKENARAYPGLLEIFESPRAKTVFTIPYRNTAMDFTDIRIVESMRIMQECIRRMQVNARRHNIELIVLLIPTKELTFKDVVFEHTGADERQGYRTLVENEEFFWRMTKNYLTEQRIAYIDVLPALRESLRQGKQPYSANFDGHPNARGHQVIAECIWSALREREGYVS